MRKWWIWSVIMALLLCGCHAAGANTDEAVGTYIGYEVCGADGAWKAMQEVYPAGENTLRCLPKGRGRCVWAVTRYRCAGRARTGN